MEPVREESGDAALRRPAPTGPDPEDSGRTPGDTEPPVVRRGLLEQLSGPEELVVLHWGRFGRTTTLLRSWVATLTDAGVATAAVLDPGSDISDHDYWGRLHGALSGHTASGTAAEAGTDPFEAVLSCVAACDEPVVVILDDLHLVPDPVSRVEDLLRHAPPSGVRIIVTTRVADDWSGPVTRGPGRKFLSSDSLNLVAEDVAALFRHLGLHYDVRTPDIICRLTGGLPALASAVCVALPVSEIAGPRHLSEHVPALVDREIDSAISGDRELAPHRRALLLSAVADPMTLPALSLAIGKEGETHALIAALERSGITRMTGSPADREWRHPAVVRESLVRLAERDMPSALDEYRSALIRHLLDDDRAPFALRVAGDARDWPRVVEIIHEHYETLYTRDYPTTMGDQILARVPAHLVEDDPILRRLHSMHHRFETLRDTVRPAGGTAAPGDDDNDDDEQNTHVLLIRALEHRIQGRFEESAALCDRIVVHARTDVSTMTTEDRNVTGFGLVHIGSSYLLSGRIGQAITIFRRSFQIAVEPFIHRDAAGKLALIYALTGSPAEARRWLEEERRHPALPAETEALVRPAGDVAAALLALDQLDTATATDVLDDLGAPADREEFWGFILYARGCLGLLEGTAATSLRFLESERSRFTSMTDHGAVVGPLLDSVRADLHLACDRAGRATETVGRSTHPLTAPARARALLLSDEPRAALAIAREMREDVLTTTRDAMELDLVAAAATLAGGDRDGARHFLDSALSTFRMTGSLLPLRSLPGHVLRRLAELVPELPVEVPDTAYGSLTFVDPEPSRSGAEPSAPRVSTPLTERELVVLRALATGATVREIATQGFVSMNTVKTQLRAVYRKLAVNSRDDAVRAAQHLDLL